MIRKTEVVGTQCRRFLCISVLFKRNAYMLRTPLSPLRVPRVTYVSVSSPRTSAGFADCLHLCVLTVHGGARNGRNAYLLRNTLSGLRFCSLPYLMVRGAASPHSCLPFLSKGRCHEVTEGIRKSAFDTANRNAGNQSAKRASLVMHFLPLLGAECRAGKERNFAPTGQRGRRDIAAYAARTRLSLR